MFRGMGLQAEDLQNQLAAGKQGWLQNSLDYNQHAFKRG